ncbi:MAG: class II fructose-bisphosphate aldolase [Chloroflexi bacterium]|nr:class II fructose-bisphosphate aldolase [Chloroflexota bacterium]
MFFSTKELLNDALQGNYAIGAFNIYNLEGVKAVISAAEKLKSPVILQIHPAALTYGKEALVAMCLSAAEASCVPTGVHLDHSSKPEEIDLALSSGLHSIMVDGSHLDYQRNIEFTQKLTQRIHSLDGVVEAELGRISGSEDGLTVPEIEAKMTDPQRALEFVALTQVDMLAVCIGNVHGRYSKPVNLDWQRLTNIRQIINIPLVLHGTSGVPDEMVIKCIELGISKFNINTELRQAYMKTIAQSQEDDLLGLMNNVVNAMQTVVEAKLRLFGSQGKA